MKRVQKSSEAALEAHRARVLQSRIRETIEWSEDQGKHVASRQDSLGDVLAASVSAVPNREGKFEWSVTNGYLSTKGSSDSIRTAKSSSEKVLREGFQMSKTNAAKKKTATITAAEYRAVLARRKQASRKQAFDDDEYEYGERSYCVKCDLDIEYVGTELSEFEKKCMPEPRGPWQDRGGNFSCPSGGYHEPA